MTATPAGSFAQTHPSLPIFVAPLTSVTAAIQAQLGHPAGTLVIIEATAAGAMYTVPAGKTFTGVAYIQGAGSGSATISAATGGTLASETFGASGGSTPDIVPVTVAGGGGGNVVSLATSGSVSLVTAALIGHVK